MKEQLDGNVDGMALDETNKQMKRQDTSFAISTNNANIWHWNRLEHFGMQLLPKRPVKWHISSAGNCMGFAMHFSPLGHNIQYSSIQHNDKYYESQDNTITVGATTFSIMTLSIT
jgi:hypothetical protein